MAEFEIEMTPSARQAVEGHCFSRVDVEVGGFLLGRIDGKTVSVEAAKPALAATSEQTHLTFTHEAWAEILDVLDEDFPGLSIVGWYHSHPGFGCFLSDYDTFIQENFFSSPGQHALVVDPLAGTWGQFVAAGGSATEIASGSTALEALAPPDASKVDAVVASAASAPRRRTWPAVLAAAFATALVVGGLAWFVGNVQGQDAAASDAKGRVDQAQTEIEDLRSQLASAQAVPQPQATPSPDEASTAAVPSPSPEPSVESTPVPIGLAIGEEGVFAVSHKIQPGDTMWDLAQRYLGEGLKYRALFRMNPGLRESGLQPGETVRILMRGTLQSVD